jgi:threonine dehydrogenase-like Zn-dependent dehydrogenase
MKLLVRHDAVGICFSDIKVIRAGENHPRIHRSMKEQPVVLGHEVALTVVEAGRKSARPIQARRPLHRAGRHLHRRQALRLRL